MTTADTPLTTHVYVDLGTAARPALIRWSSSAGGSDEAYALLTADGPVLIDPREVAASADADLWSLIGRPPIATVLTNDWHERACYVVRERWGTPVWAPAAGLRARGGELDGVPDHTYEEDTPLPGGLRAIRIAGVFAGEHVLLWSAPSGERVLFTGDAVSGQVTERSTQHDSWRCAPGLYLGVGYPYIEWLADPARLRESLARVLDEEFDVLCGAHSRPYFDDPKAALRHLLAQDWPAILRAGGRPAVYTRLLQHARSDRRDRFPMVARPLQ